MTNVNCSKKIGNTDQFLSKTQLRQKKLFLDTPVVKAVLWISLPSMMMALMAALYMFCDQIMMANLIPQYSPFESLINSKITNFNYSNYQEIVKLLNNNGLNITEYSSQSIVRNAVANSAPITVVINATTLLIANGTSVSFSKMNGKKDVIGAEKTWAIGFYNNLFICLLVSSLLLALCPAIISLENGDPLSQLEQIKDKAMAIISADQYQNLYQVYKEANNMIIEYAQNYSFIIISAMILSMFDSFFSLLIISEGRQKMVVFAAVVSNVVNLIMDFVLIYVVHLAIVSGALATLIGWTFNCSWYIIQIHLLNKKNDTGLVFSALNLKRHGWDWKITKQIFFTGLASFLRNLSMAVAAWLQLFLLSSLVIPSIETSGGSASAYANFYGAINPIYNLFFPIMLGTIQGSRIMCSYLYGSNQYKRFRQTYWIAMMIGLIYGFLMMLLIGVALNSQMLGIFQINSSQPNFDIAQMMLLIAMLQMPIYAFTIGGQIIFQATSKSLFASICGLMQGFICNLPISFIIAGIAMNIKVIELFLWNPVIVVCTSSAIILTWTLWYMRRYFSPDILNNNIRYLNAHKCLDPKSYK